MHPTAPSLVEDWFDPGTFSFSNYLQLLSILFCIFNVFYLYCILNVLLLLGRICYRPLVSVFIFRESLLQIFLVSLYFYIAIS